MNKKKPTVVDSPQAGAQREEILHGTFVRQGTMVAFPLCFPGASIPIVADESHITALDIADNSVVYGGTSGRQTHIFGAAFHGSKGVVFDLGTVEHADYCAAICCGRDKLIACVNGPDGGRLIRCELQFLPLGGVSDLLQEWGFTRPAFEDLGPAISGERIIHATADQQRRNAIVMTENHLVSVDIENGEITIIDQVPGLGQLVVGSTSSILGFDTDNSLWSYNSDEGSVIRHAVSLPEGNWQEGPLKWAGGRSDGVFYTADNDGSLFAFAEGRGFSQRLGRTPLTPVGPMSTTFDGRLFGACGSGIAKLFCYNPGDGQVLNLGVANSVIERRRYGYVFGDAVTGRDGQIFFGEDDDLGHLWIYFPSIQRSTVFAASF